MNSIVLVPYCPWPADSGGKAEILKHLHILREMGGCRIASASSKPVGAGWSRETLALARKQGFEVVLREDSVRSWNAKQAWGMAYGSVCKSLRLERAFGHSNPYHRHAFPSEWWRRHTEDADIAVLNYSYWAHLPSAAPKAMVLLDLWSQYMWEGPRREREDLGSCDAVFVISKDEEAKMSGWGIRKIVWSPPAVAPSDFTLTERVGLVGSGNVFNVEGLRWLEQSPAGRLASVRVYGNLAGRVRSSALVPVGPYDDPQQPYRECGMILFPTVQGMGVQIKTIEALAAGRAIVARRGAVRGLPPGDGAWIEVDTATEMWEASSTFASDPVARSHQGEAARAYYRKHLDHEKILHVVRETYMELAACRERSVRS